MTSGQADLFPGFDSLDVDAGEVTLHARVGGKGLPLLLLHGYPQTHLMWHRVAGELARHFTVIAPDLRGYGRSTCPPTDDEHRAYSKRVMARDMATLMDVLGHRRFAVMGHDRGARVGYRLALDEPDRIERLVILDIIATPDQWAAASQKVRLKMFHWAFLAQPAPLPESLIGLDPVDWIQTRFKRGLKSGSLDDLDPAALAEYTRVMRDPDHIHASCEDFRAGAERDLADDQADLAAGRRIACPALVVWARHGPLAGFGDPLALWQPWCRSVTTQAIDCGHYIAEERPHALLAHALPFLLQSTGGAL